MFKDHEIRFIIKSDKRNKYLGVYLFSFIIRNSLFKLLNLELYFKKKSAHELYRLEIEIRNAERGHLFAFYSVIVGSLIFLLLTKNRFDFLLINFWNVVFNLYPILALQLQRKRIYKILHKQIV